jgi:hypothetical protein
VVTGLSKDELHEDAGDVADITSDVEWFGRVTSSTAKGSVTTSSESMEPVEEPGDSVSTGLAVPPPQLLVSADRIIARERMAGEARLNFHIRE